MEAVTSRLVQVAAEGDVERFLADATLYLDFFGNIAIAWQWLLQGLTAQDLMQKDATEAETMFYEGKLYAMRYFFHYELPKIDGLAKTAFGMRRPYRRNECSAFFGLDIIGQEGLNAKYHTKKFCHRMNIRRPD